MCEIATCIILKNSVNFLNTSFLVKEETNDKNLDIILFACSGIIKGVNGIGNMLEFTLQPISIRVISAH